MRRNIAFFYGILLLFMVAGVTARSLLAQTAADNLLIDEDVLSVDDVLPLGDDPAEKGAEDVPLPEDPTLDLLPEPAPADDVPKLAPVDDGADLDSLIESAFSDAVAEGVPEPPSLPTAAYGAGDVEASVVPMAPASPQQQMIDVITGGEILRRQAFEHHALETLGRADEILKERDYDKSRRLYEQSIEVIRQSGERPENTALRQRARAGIAESLYREALLLTKLMDYDKAEQQARAASSYGHAKAPKLVGEISELKKDPPLPPPAAVPPRWRQDDFREAEKEVADLLRRGREHFVSGEYRKSQVLFESVIKRDPNNTEAIRMRQKVAQMRLDISRMEVDSTHVDMVRQIGDAWNPRDYASEDDVRPTFSTEDSNRTQRQETDEDRILSKMEAIRIPEIDFRQANIHDVVNFLQEASVEYDPSDDPNAPKGVNIILNLQAIGETDASAPAAEADPFGFGAAEPVGGGGPGGDVPLVTFNARYISLLEALRIVTRVTRLEYRVDGSVVMIVPFGTVRGEIIHRMYNVLPTFLDEIDKFNTDLEITGGGGGRASDFITMGGGAAISSDRADPKQFFQSLGVPWPHGTSIKYVSAIGTLVVANTAENLAIFEDILAKINIVPNQIEIEARFVEVNQDDLDALGFEWLLTDDWVLAQRQGNGNVPPALQERLLIPANSSQGGFTKGQRFVNDMTEGLGAGVASDVMSFASVLTNPEIELVVHALSRKENTDLLSAPKVTTKSGSEATIKVVTEYIYPTDFSVEPITGTDANGNSTIVGGVVEPSGFETREVGVILSVLPEVSPEGQMINLTLNPEVVEEPIWYEYGSVYTAPDGSQQQLNMQQPFFRTRTVTTSVSVYNGATVVLGGMIIEVRNEVEDKIPILGDIPLLGRFFRSRYEQSAKRNLLIFVTARLVDPAGRPLGSATDLVSGSGSMNKELSRAPTGE